MNNVDELKQAVERLHNCKASHIEDVVLVEKFGEKLSGVGLYRFLRLKATPRPLNAMPGHRP